MRSDSLRILLGLGVVLALAVSACAPATPTPEPTEAPPPTEAPTEPMAETEPPTEAAQPSVTVSDQDASGGTVTVDSTTAAQPGWMVIHADADGSPGAVIGHAPVEQGSNENVTVEIELSQATPTLYAMLHVDSGEMGTYEFPDGDPPARVGDQIVVQPFTVTLPEGEMGAEPDLAVADSDLGHILVNAEGLTLYAFTQDSADQSACTGGCPDIWPPLTVEEQPVAGEGVNSDLLGTLTRGDGSAQVTYDGHPLYTYSEDTGPGDTNGQGFGGSWYVVSPDGELIRQASAGEEEEEDGGYYDY